MFIHIRYFNGIVSRACVEDIDDIIEVFELDEDNQVTSIVVKFLGDWLKFFPDGRYVLYKDGR